MRIKDISVENYRNLNSATITFDESCNFIVGENNLGKSNILNLLNIIFTRRGFVYDDFNAAKLLQKSEMRKDIVIELSYKGFSWSGYNSWSQYNHSKSQILTPQRYLFVTMPDNATNGYGWRNKTLRNSELPTTHAKNLVTEKDCAVPPRFAYRHRTLHQLILKPKN